MLIAFWPIIKTVLVTSEHLAINKHSMRYVVSHYHVHIHNLSVRIILGPKR